MKLYLTIIGLSFVMVSCKNPLTSRNQHDVDVHLNIAQDFIQAFYSFDEDLLDSILSEAMESRPSILYYQKWAECGNYQVINRHNYIIVNDSFVKCPVTVKDDLIGSLGLDFHVTDTFHLKIISGQVRAVATSSNDPALYYEAKEWVKLNRPELIEGPCEGMLDDGPTPCECVRAMVQGFKEFIAEKHEPGKASLSDHFIPVSPLAPGARPGGHPDTKEPV